jgi:hypothetical protein
VPRAVPPWPHDRQHSALGEAADREHRHRHRQPLSDLAGGEQSLRNRFVVGGTPEQVELAKVALRGPLRGEVDPHAFNQWERGDEWRTP